MALLDLGALVRAPLTRDPFTFTVVRDFVPPANAEAIRGDFPAIAYPGLLPVEATEFGPRFGELIEELQSEPVARAFSEKFDDGWEADGGRLRLLRRPDDLNDMIAEVPPTAGTLIAFRRSDRSDGSGGVAPVVWPSGGPGRDRGTSGAAVAPGQAHRPDRRAAGPARRTTR